MADATSGAASAACSIALGLDSPNELSAVAYTAPASPTPSTMPKVRAVPSTPFATPRRCAGTAPSTALVLRADCWDPQSYPRSSIATTFLTNCRRACDTSAVLACIRPHSGKRLYRPHVRAAVLGATLVVLAERGFDGLELPEVAPRAGVNASTVYRRWGPGGARRRSAARARRSLPCARCAMPPRRCLVCQRDEPAEG
jgi:hypothetical protein